MKMLRNHEPKDAVTEELKPFIINALAGRLAHTAMC